MCITLTCIEIDSQAELEAAVAKNGKLSEGLAKYRMAITKFQEKISSLQQEVTEAKQQVIPSFSPWSVVLPFLFSWLVSLFI